MHLRTLAAGAAVFWLAASPLAHAQDGKAVYNGICVACHAAGVAGAPKTGDAAAWKERIAKGTDQLVTAVIIGVQGSGGVMPPRGGNPNLSDAEIRAAVEYMVAESQ